MNDWKRYSADIWKDDGGSKPHQIWSRNISFPKKETGIPAPSASEATQTYSLHDICLRKFPTKIFWLQYFLRVLDCLQNWQKFEGEYQI